MLTDLQKDILQQLLRNEPLLAVIKKAFDNVIETSIPKVNDIDNNSVLGEKYRAYIEARSIIDNCFRELESYKTEKLTVKDFNKAR